MDTAAQLLELAQEKFGKLTAAEKKLFRAAAEGEVADYSPRSKKPIDPANAAKWGPSRVLLADRIAWLCTDKQASQLVTHRGIGIKGVRIDEMFDLGDAKISFPLHLELCKFTEHIILAYAQIAALYMLGSHTYSTKADSLKIDGSFFLREGFKAEGEVYIPGATVGGDLDCSNAKFMNKRGRALSADRLKVGGGVFLRNGFEAQGEVRLPGAVVGGDISCTGGKFVNKGGTAFSGDGLDVKGNFWFRNGFEADGGIRLAGATVGSNLDCRGGAFTARDGVGIFANHISINGDLLLCDGLKAKGEVSLVAAQIDGLLHCTGLASTEELKLDLRYARIGTLRDERESWPVNGKLYLHGLTYKEIHNNAPRDCKTRVNWIRRQGKFWSQPYEQLAKVLQESGDTAEARNVLVVKNKDKARLTKLTFPEKCWYHFLGRAIGYGYKPWMALPLALVIVLFGSVFFKEGYSHGLLTPPSESAYTDNKSGIPDLGDKSRRISAVYPVFHSFFYSIDVFIPVVDLRQVRYWLPNANRGSEIVQTSSQSFCWGGLLLFWLWIETALGWVLTTLFLVGLTGLVRT